MIWHYFLLVAHSPARLFLSARLFKFISQIGPRRLPISWCSKQPKRKFIANGRANLRVPLKYLSDFPVTRKNAVPTAKADATTRGMVSRPDSLALLRAARLEETEGDMEFWGYLAKVAKYRAWQLI